jgi:hypothetical protein
MKKGRGFGIFVDNGLLRASGIYMAKPLNEIDQSHVKSFLTASRAAEWLTNLS